MGQKNMKTKLYTVLVVVFALICAVQAFALPDIPPTCSLSSNTQDADTTAVLTAVSTDSLANAGVSSIKIYEDGSLISSKSCNGATTCVSVKSVIHMSDGTHSYHAVCRDIAGQSTTSSTVTVDFNGGNHDPEITSATPASPIEILENETALLEVEAEDEDGDTLAYGWSVNNIFILNYNHPYLDFSRNVDGTSQDFDVRVSVTDNMGGYDSASWDITVIDLEPSVVLTGDDGLTECDQFGFDANIDSYDSITSIVWDFGDGTNQTGTNASVQHTFPEDGTYTVRVTVTDADGDTDSDTLQVDVLDIAPQDLAFTWDPAAPFEADLVSFTADAGMACAADDIADWSWDFDDDGAEDANGQTADNTFDQDGTYPVTLTVTDDDGSETELTLDVVVADIGPEAGFTWDPADPIEGDTVDFTDTSTSHDGITGWSWDFDDDGIEDSSDQDPSWAFDLEGTHSVCLTVSEDDGSEDTVCNDVLVGNNVPEVLLEADDPEGPEPHDVHFDCSVTAGGNAPFDYEIDFGDNSPAVQDSEADHTYDMDGIYTATCTVTDTDGDEGTGSVDITVDNVVPDVELILNETSGPEPLDVHADCFAYDGNEPYNFSIDFGDGTIVNNDTADHTYDQDGLYDVVCTVTDVDGDVSTDTVPVDVADTMPAGDFTWDPEFPNEGEQVDFDATADAYDGIVSWSWDFADGSTADVEDPSHTFANGGDYDVTLVVEDGDGSQLTIVHTVHVVDNPPIVEVYADPLDGDEPLSVDITCTLLDNAQGDPSGDGPFTFDIDFGDGDSYSVLTSDREYSRTHEYVQNGIYTVTCNVTDSDGDPGSDTEDVEVFDTEPDVDLHANLVEGDEPLDVVFFCDASAYDTPLSYELDFGDGSPMVEDNGADHVYNQSGLYTATCTVTDADGSIVSDTIDIDVYDTLPNVSFTWDPVNPLELEDVDFDATVTGHDEPFTFAWDFDDDGVTDSTDEDTTWIFPQNDTYPVTLTVTDADGSVVSVVQNVTVGDNSPWVDLTVNTTSGDEPLSVGYSCAVAPGTGNDPLDYLIDFGDGMPTSTDADGEHTYNNPGDYDMTCTVTDADGDVDSDTVVINVADNAPVVEITADGVPGYLEGTEGDTVDFNCTITGGNAPFTTQMDFDDGTTTANLVESHTYPLEGLYNVSCWVQDNDLDNAEDFVLVNITNNAPVVNLDVSPDSGLEPLTVNYTCDVGGGNDPLSYVIDFGDGTPTSTDDSGNHTYPAPGDYDMTCTVTDTDGDVDSDSFAIEVIDNPPVVDLTAIPMGGDEGVDILFTCDVTGGNEPFSYVIDFDDGNSSTEPVILHTYTLEGSYNATCTVTDADGDIGSDSEVIVVGNNVPVVNLIENVSAGVEPLAVDFNCTVGGGNSPYSYSIDFGDGSPAVPSPVATHEYVQNDTYFASCTVTDVDGDSSADTDAIAVYDTEPDTNFTFSPSDPIEGDLVQFTDQTTAYDGIVAWSWDLGDGNTSTAQNPSKTYDLEGSYFVTLTTTDSDGSQTSHSEWVNVGNNVPVVNTTVTPSSGTEPLSVLITCSASGGNAPLAYEIFFGDGNSAPGSAAAYTYDQDGSYPVVCQVTDTDGDVGSDLQTVIVNDTVPTADFSWLPANPEAGDVVSFTDLSTSYDGLAAWSWDFDNDGVEDSNVQDPSTIYSSPGLYQVNLSVTDDDGSTAWTMKTIAINVSFPAPIIFNVQAVNLTNVSADITWATDQAADSLVEFGTDPAILGSSVSDAALDFSHALPLSGLTPNTMYFFNVTSCNMHADCTTEGPFNFTTLATSTDTTPPIVSLDSPADGSVDADGVVTVQYTVTDDIAANLDCYIYSNTTGSWQLDAAQMTANGASNTFMYLGLADGDYRWNVECSDGTNSAFAPADFSFTVNTSVVDVTPPVVTLMSPADTSIDNDGNVTVQYNVTDDMATLLSCEIHSNTSGVWAVDLAGQLTANGSSNTFDYTGLPDGHYVWNVRCNDGTNAFWALTDWTFDVDTGSSGSVPVVSASANPSSGAVPLLVRFNATVTGGDAPLSFEWDIDNDGIVDYTTQDPVHIYNAPGVYTAVVNVTDADGDWDSDTVTVTASAVTHNVAVDSLTYTNMLDTIYLYDSVQIDASVSNTGNVQETFDVVFEVDGVVIDTQQVTLGAGASTVVSTSIASAQPEGFHTFVARAEPVAGETDLSDQSQTEIARYWSVDDIVSSKTRYIVYWAGTAYVPITNAYVHETFNDLRVELTSTGVPPAVPVQLVDLNPSETQILTWSVAALPGDTLTAIEGNNEVTFSLTV